MLATDGWAAGNVDRLSRENSQVQLELIRNGFRGKLHSAEEWAQFYILLCQPKKAWISAEKVTDESSRKLFEGVILALSATPRAAAADDLDIEDSEPVAKKAKAEVRFAFDQAEVWADEPGKLQIDSECEFPLVAADKQAELALDAKTRLLEAVTDPSRADLPRFSLLALATDQRDSDDQCQGIGNIRCGSP